MQVVLCFETSNFLNKTKKTSNKTPPPKNKKSSSQQNTERQPHTEGQLTEARRPEDAEALALRRLGIVNQVEQHVSTAKPTIQHLRKN